MLTQIPMFPPITTSIELQAFIIGSHLSFGFMWLLGCILSNNFSWEFEANDLLLKELGKFPFLIMVYLEFIGLIIYLVFKLLGG